jgi:integrase
VYAPDLRLNVTLPKIPKKIKQLPPVQDVLRAVIGSEIELPCLLAMWLGLRMSEIRGAKKTDIKGGILTIHDTIVTVDGEHIEKHSTKTIDSTRQISLPERLQRLINALPDEQLYLTTLSGNALYKRFSRLLEDNHIEHMTFHELRHMNVSVMVLLGIPDKYAMERGGWSSPHIMQSVYQHTFSEERTEVDKRIDEYFNAMVESL